MAEACISKILRFFTAFLVAIGVRAGAPADDVVARLSHVKLFAFGGVGFAGVITQGEKDYDTILSKPSARVDFEKVFAGGTPEAKAYALVGLHKVDVERFRSVAGPLRASTESFQSAQGCLIGRRTIADLVRGIESGEYPNGSK